MKKAMMTILTLAIIVLSLSGVVSKAQGQQVVWWDFEGNLDGTDSIDLTGVANSTAGLTPTVSFNFQSVTGVNALNSGGQAVEFSGSNVLKTNNTSLRLGDAQTFWLRVNFDAVPAGNTALMTRSRAVNGARGISLQMNDGRLRGFLSEDGQTYDTQLLSGSSYQLEDDTWYDISMRYDPSAVLRIDIYDPMTGTLIDTLETFSNIPDSIATSNGIGSGFFQVGSINNGSAGSNWLVPAGTLIEAAGVWDEYLTDQEIADLSAIPEPNSFGLLMLGSMFLAARIVTRRSSL